MKSEHKSAKIIQKNGFSLTFQRFVANIYYTWCVAVNLGWGFFGTHISVAQQELKFGKIDGNKFIGAECNIYL